MSVKEPLKWSNREVPQDVWSLSVFHTSMHAHHALSPEILNKQCPLVCTDTFAFLMLQTECIKGSVDQWDVWLSPSWIRRFRKGWILIGRRTDNLRSSRNKNGRGQLGAVRMTPALLWRCFPKTRDSRGIGGKTLSELVRPQQQESVTLGVTAHRCSGAVLGKLLSLGHGEPIEMFPLTECLAQDRTHGLQRTACLGCLLINSEHLDSDVVSCAPIPKPDCY